MTDFEQMQSLIDFLTQRVQEFSEAMEVYRLLTLAIDEYLVVAPADESDALLRIIDASGYNERFNALIGNLNRRPSDATLH